MSRVNIRLNALALLAAVVAVGGCNQGAAPAVSPGCACGSLVPSPASESLAPTLTPTDATEASALPEITTTPTLPTLRPPDGGAPKPSIEIPPPIP
jgi:hypothetical protein